jgi:hypothetical protein
MTKLYDACSKRVKLLEDFWGEQLSLALGEEEVAVESGSHFQIIPFLPDLFYVFCEDDLWGRKNCKAHA